MFRKQLIHKLRYRKKELEMTIKEISVKSGVSIRSINRIFAGEDVRFSSIEAVMDALELSITIDKNGQSKV